MVYFSDIEYELMKYVCDVCGYIYMCVCVCDWYMYVEGNSKSLEFVIFINYPCPPIENNLVILNSAENNLFIFDVRWLSPSHRK
jgi:hypothetical protein